MLLAVLSALQATESLSNLVSKMSDQVKLSEETTSNLLHSSSVLKGTESEFDSMRAHITVRVVASNFSCHILIQDGCDLCTLFRY